MEDERDVVYASLGPLAAILVGMALVPLRGVTTASNFTFVFLVLVILVAEWGGRAAALLTAVAAALSLNFFLTEPYLRLAIHGRDDVIAFVGLGACGLLAAALGSERSRRARDLAAARRHLDVLHTTLDQLGAGGPVEPALGRVLNAMKGAFPVAAAVVRDERNNLVAASDQAHARPPLVRPLPVDAVLPAEGGRLALVARNRQVGWMDLWGNGSLARPEAQRVLRDVAHLIAGRLESEARPPTPA